MPDFRLRVFQAVARHLSFTKAAQELCITQPAVTKHIRELERSYEQRLFERRGNRVSLTEAGQLLLRYAGQVHELHHQLAEQLHTLHDTTAGRLRLGASSTLAQYVVPPILPGFQARYPRVELTLLIGNSEQVAEALLRGEIDLGLVEGQVKNRDLHYEFLLDDELVAVRRGTGAALAPQPLAEVLRHPLVLRERGSGTLEVLELALRDRGIRLAQCRVAIYLDNTEGIKSYLEAAPECVGFVSVRGLKKELASGELAVVPIEELRLTRHFEAVWLQGQPLLRAAEQFLRYAHQQFGTDAHNQK
ncbi:LysR substrate-binding domain-containing protein [Hymenobacter jeollabukensis]|uniref:LysR family transcriptional regulator n=1 Tax=Hymenobacter jeollabukensis TaxID=2025313 RepID=A0A5R8WMA9_9BACT|nr:LysR substrate-binding domain-containing protein [Hymenobacter jeollabukensis]TLM90556.1 LysR family transcriptional regulator [Hymenobacter jeollabukensis]